MSIVVNGLVVYPLVIGLAERRPFSLTLTAFAIACDAHFNPTLLPLVSPAGVSGFSHVMGLTVGVVAALELFRKEHKTT